MNGGIVQTHQDRVYQLGYEQGLNHGDCRGWERGYREGRNLTWGGILAVLMLQGVAFAALCGCLWWFR